MKSKRIITYILVAVIYMFVNIPSGIAELDIPIVTWVEGQAYCDGKLMTNCVVYDSNDEEHYVIVDLNGYEFKRDKSYEKLIGLNSEYGTVNVFAEVPENFKEKEIDVVLEDAVEEHIVRLYDYNGYMNYISLLTGDVSVIDCYVAGDTEFKYEIESAVSVKVSNETDAELIVKVKDTSSAEQENQSEPEVVPTSEAENLHTASPTVTPTAEKPSPTPMTTDAPPISSETTGKVNFADFTHSTGNANNTVERKGKSDMSMDEYMRNIEEKRKGHESIGVVVYATTEPTFEPIGTGKPTLEPTFEPIGTGKPTLEPTIEPIIEGDKDNGDNDSNSNIIFIVLLIIGIIAFILWRFLGKRDSDSRK